MSSSNKLTGNRRSASLILSFIIAISQTLLLASPVLAQGQAETPIGAGQNPAREMTLARVMAWLTPGGVLLEWRTSFELNNLGFHVYRVRGGQRLRVNRTLIPGSFFRVGQGVTLADGYSYRWLDRSGTSDSIYYLEAEGVDGKLQPFDQGLTVVRPKPGAGQSSESLGAGSAGSSAPSVKEFPSSLVPPQSAEGSLDTQWKIAAQSALKISINHDAWYRVTQQQMVAAGFNPAVDTKNLSLYLSGQEIAIRTSKPSGPFMSGDYFEFYGQGIDTPTTDTQVYYLIANTQAGKRTTGDLHADEIPVTSPSPNIPSQPRAETPFNGWFTPTFNLPGEDKTIAPAVSSAPKRDTQAATQTPDSQNETATPRLPNPAATPAEAEPSLPAVDETRRAVVKNETKPVAPAAPARASISVRTPPGRAIAKKRGLSRRKSHKHSRSRISKKHYAHVLDLSSASAPSFSYSVQDKERQVYIFNLLNGPASNYFGQVISSNPVTVTLNAHNVMTTADGPAKLVVALQGVQSSVLDHQVRVFFNDVFLSTINFFSLENSVQTFDIPVAQLHEGSNTVKLVQGSNGDVSVVDYLTLTYPHSYRAFNDSLRFSMRGSQLQSVDGFSTPNVRLLDISDPTAVKVTRPMVATGSSGYAITVQPAAGATKAGRLLLALPEGQFETPAALSLNQPSTLNQPATVNPANSADLLIISYKDFIPSTAPLVAKRQAEGLVVRVVDIEDVFDEFSYGGHTPQAIKDFLARAITSWTGTLPVGHPRFVLFVGDASYDPRNFEGVGNFDFVPTELVDTLFEETCSDDLLADFNGDGIADIPVGRLSARTTAEADLMVSKIVNFSKANVPQTALLVADDPTGYFFDFEQASDHIGTLLPQTFSLQKVYRRIEGDSLSHSDIINKWNAGVALVNYTGHGNVNVWTGANIFTNTDARALTNGNKLPLVIVADCLNGLFDAPQLEGMSESFLKNPNGGAVAVFASSGKTVPDGQQEMSNQLYQSLFGQQSVFLGDAIHQSKLATTDIDVRRTWVLLGDPSMKIW